MHACPRTRARGRMPISHARARMRTTTASTNAQLKRRAVLLGSAVFTLPATPPANAALDAVNQENINNALRRALFAAPVRIPRPNLKLPFAVLLMRSSYEALENTNIYDMREFQIEFWRLRADMQPSYVESIKPGLFRQGDLTDSLYFDFINYSQWVTTKGVIERSSAFNAQLGAQSGNPLRGALTPAVYLDEVAETLYNKLSNGFTLTPESDPVTFDVPAPLARDDDVLEGVSKLMQVFVNNGYATRIDVKRMPPPADGGGVAFAIETTGGCTLWGNSQLRKDGKTKLPGGDALINAYECIALRGYLAKSQRVFASRVDEVDDVRLVTKWVVSSLP